MRAQRRVISDVPLFVVPAGQKEELGRYAAAGGLVVMDAAGGSPDFAMAAETELAATLPDVKLLTPLPASHPLFAAGASAVTYRPCARRVIGNKSEPQLTGFGDGKRLLAVLSPFDLSAGLVGQNVDGISGYTPESATALMRSILLHASPPPATKPAPAKATKKQ